MASATSQSSVRSADAGLFANLLASVKSSLARRAVYARTLRELNELSPRDLADLGLSGADIHSVAREAAYGR